MSAPSVSLSARLGLSKVSYENPGENHLLITLEGGKLDKSKTRKPLRVGAAIDTSGSMAGQKLDFAIKSLCIFVDNLTADDMFGVCGFSDNVFSVVKPAFMTPENKEAAKAEIRGLRSMSATNLSGATIEAFNLANADRPKKDKVPKAEFGKLGAAKIIDDANDVDDGFLCRGFLFTDGQPTAGDTSKEGLIKLAGSRIGGASLTAFGYGSDHDAELLASMASKGGGNYYFIEDFDKCPAFFGRELGGLISCMAQGIKIKIKAASGVKFTKVFNDLDVDASDDQSECTISMDDVYAEEKRKILILTELPEKSKAVAARASKLCDIEVTYVDLKTGEKVKLEDSVKIEYVKEDEADKKVDKEVEEQIVRFKGLEAQEEARAFADRGNFAGGQSVLRSFSAFAGNQGWQGMADDVGEAALYLSDAGTYESGGKKGLMARSMSYGTGRGGTIETAAMFGTRVQADTAAKFQDESKSGSADAAGGATGGLGGRAATGGVAGRLSKKRSRK